MRINGKNFFDRKLENVPPHFTKFSKWFSDYELINVDRWIHENCAGRYCLVKTVEWDRNAWRAMTTVGFEEPGDMTLVALSGLATKK